jgi:Tol biopolymer transport system component
VATGALLFERESTLMALPFDPRKLRPVDSAVPIVQDVPQAGTAGFGAFTASENGILLYRNGGDVGNQTFIWLDSSGKATEALKDSQPFQSFSVSPDGKRLAVSILLSGARVSATGSEDIWLHDFERQTLAKFTFGPGRQRHGLWSPDSSYIVYSRLARGETFLRKPTQNGGAEEVLWETGLTNAIPQDISHDGKLMVYSATGSSTKDDLWFLPLEGNHAPMKYLDGPSEERHAQFSRDDKWIAYSSDESSGQYQVFLQSIPPGNKRQISSQGGSRPRWRKDGKELYYISADLKMMAVPINIGPGTLEIGTPQQLFPLPAAIALSNPREIGYEPSPDGKRFLVLVPSEQRADTPPSATVRINWMSLLNK